jgi:hypothetical protein
LTLTALNSCIRASSFSNFFFFGKISFMPSQNFKISKMSPPKFVLILMSPQNLFILLFATFIYFLYSFNLKKKKKKKSCCILRCISIISKIPLHLLYDFITCSESNSLAPFSFFFRSLSSSHSTQLHHDDILLPSDASIFLDFTVIEYWLPTLINFMVLSRNLIAVIVGSFCDDQRRMPYAINKS